MRKCKFIDPAGYVQLKEKFLKTGGKLNEIQSFESFCPLHHYLVLDVAVGIVPLCVAKCMSSFLPVVFFYRSTAQFIVGYLPSKTPTFLLRTNMAVSRQECRFAKHWATEKKSVCLLEWNGFPSENNDEVLSPTTGIYPLPRQAFEALNLNDPYKQLPPE